MTAIALRKERRSSIQRLEAAILEAPQVEMETIHHFADGLYARELRIPAGVILTGKIHKTEHINIVSKGKIAVVTEFGEEIIAAPCTMVSKPGTKRAGYALEDTVWTTIHASKERDLDALERELIAETHFELLEEAGEPECLGQQPQQ